MDIIGFISEVIIAIAKHGWSVSTLVIFIFALFKFAPFRRVVMRHLPRKLRMLDNRMDGMDVRLGRMEAKLDAIARHMGADPWNVEERALTGNTVPSLLKSSPAATSRADSVAVFIRRMKNLLNTRRMKRMKQLLIKWGSRKFQAFLMVTITNMIIFVGFLMGFGDIEERVTEWTPLINIGLQFLASAVYMWVEGKVDTANAKAGGGYDYSGIEAERKTAEDSNAA